MTTCQNARTVRRAISRFASPKLTRYFRDYGGHILEVESEDKPRDLFCKVCGRLLDVRLDCTEMIKHYGVLYELFSPRGQVIQRGRLRRKARERLAKINWQQAHPEYSRQRAEALGETLKAQQRDLQKKHYHDPQFHDQILQKQRRHKKKPEVRKRAMELQHIRRGLALLGLGTNHVKRHQIRKKMKARALMHNADPMTMMAVKSS